MEITKLQLIKNKRYIVFVDGEIAFVLYKGDLRRFRINEGDTLSQKDYETIITEVLPKRAEMRLLHLLEKRDYTEYQLRDKLREGYYPQNIIDQAIEKMKGYRYVDDERYAKRYIESLINRKSTRQIILELERKGIKKSLIQQMYLELEDEGNIADEYAIAINILKKRKYAFQEADEKEKAKQMRYLLGKGIPSDIAWRALGMKEEC